MGDVEVQPQAAKTLSIQHLDESTFQQILQAAYVIQKQKDFERRPSVSEPPSSLAVIADTQELLRSKSYDLNAAAKLIIERLGRIISAKGSAIALISDDALNYCAALGSLRSLDGHRGPVENEVSDFLRQERTLNRTASDARSELLGRHDDSPVFFPIFCDGRIAAVMQLVFPKSAPIQKDQIQTCQLMAGLMGEAISRSAEVEWKQSLENERATMLKALERLQPHLQRLAAEPTPQSSTNGKASKGVESAEIPFAATTSEQEPELTSGDTFEEPGIPKLLEELLSSTCQNCGTPFMEGAKFCGKCGERISEESDHSDLSSEETVPAEEMPELLHDHMEHDPVLPGVVSQMPALSVSPAIDGSTALAVAPQVAESEETDENKLQLVPPSETPEDISPWSSATRAREWLHSLQPKQPGWLAKHSGDISIVTAALVLILVALGSSSRPPASKIASSKVPVPSISLFDRLLVGLGVADAPAAPAHLGNPNVTVWEDLHTGLYYCPGADLYEKTSGGKLTNQRDAQLDQFEPAARRACD